MMLYKPKTCITSFKHLDSFSLWKLIFRSTTTNIFVSFLDWGSPQVTDFNRYSNMLFCQFMIIVQALHYHFRQIEPINRHDLLIHVSIPKQWITLVVDKETTSFFCKTFFFFIYYKALLGSGNIVKTRGVMLLKVTQPERETCFAWSESSLILPVIFSTGNFVAQSFVLVWRVMLA